MRYTTKTEYALICLSFMVKNSKGQPVTIKQIANVELMPIPYLEKIFQKLRAADIVKSIQGNTGGYVLSRPAGLITMKSVVDAMEGATFSKFCEPANCESFSGNSVICTHNDNCGLKPIWYKTEEILNELYSSISIEQLSQGEEAVKQALVN